MRWLDLIFKDHKFVGHFLSLPAVSLQSAIRNPQSAIRNPQSAIRNHLAASASASKSFVNPAPRFSSS